MTVVVDLFAGAGGWDVAAEYLGIAALGVEVDPAACRTREAAGLRTLKADVAALSPRAIVNPADCDGLIGSPPCPTFSAGGRGAGRHLTDVIVRCMHELAAGNDRRQEAREEAYGILYPLAWQAECARALKRSREPSEETAQANARRDAAMSMLVVEPMRWALALSPPWIALEQVPEVLGLWSVMAQILGTLGYSTWTGRLECERYGVPQTRERAILMASRVGPANAPPPTHQQYVKGEPQRHEHTLEGEILPWISMAEALGWGMTARPSVTVAAKPSETGGRRGLAAGSGSEATIAAEQARGAWLTDTGNTRGGTRAEGRSRRATEPAPAVTSRADQLEWRDAPPGDVRRTYDEDEPAPTLTASGLAKGRDVWIEAASRQPAPTVTAGGTGSGGGVEVFGYRGCDVRTEMDEKRVRVTVEEAAALQGFPEGYPWTGTRGEQFTQVGNAIPPPLALAVLRQLARVDETARREELVA